MTTTGTKGTIDEARIKDPMIIKDWLEGLKVSVFTMTHEELKNLFEDKIVLYRCGNDVVLYRKENDKYIVRAYSKADFSYLFAFDYKKITFEEITLDYEAAVIKMSFFADKQFYAYPKTSLSHLFKA